MFRLYACYPDMFGIRTFRLGVFRPYAFLNVLDGFYLSEILINTVFIKLSYEVLVFQPAILHNSDFDIKEHAA